MFKDVPPVDSPAEGELVGMTRATPIRDVENCSIQELVAAIEDGDMPMSVAGSGLEEEEQESSYSEASVELPDPEAARREMRRRLEAGLIRSQGTLPGRRTKSELPKAPKVVTTESVAQKLRIAVSLAQALELTPNLRHLMTHLVSDATKKAGDIMRLPEGTRVELVSPDQMEKEKKIVSSAPLNDAETVRKQLRRLELEMSRPKEPSATRALRRSRRNRGEAALVTRDVVEELVDAVH